MAWILAFVLIGAIVWWALRQRVTPGRSSSQLDRDRSEGIESLAGIFGLGDSQRVPTPVPHEMLLAAFRSDEQPIPEDAERDDHRTLVSSLLLAADHLGARDVVLWQQDPDNPDQMQLVANARGAPPTVSNSEQSMLLWSAQEGVFAGDTGGEQSVRLLVVPVALGLTSGAVSAHFGEEPTAGRTALREWLARHATGVAALHELVRTRAETARRNYKLRATIRTAKTLQGSRDPKALEEALVRDSLIVVGATWGILVRWDSGSRMGLPKVHTDDAPVFGVRVEARQGSLVGDVCLGGMPRVFSDARALIAGREAVFDSAPLPQGTGSLLVVPLRRSEQEPVLGALLCGHPETRALSMSDAHAARELGVIAAGALETAWAVQEATERASTDQLTGLANRRHFDEQFARMIGETDRYGGSAALVLADIDFFKAVNDTHGHEAGDQVLIAVSHALAGERRTTDFAARIGGEEIALLLPQTDASGALELTERLRARVESLRVRTNSGEVQVTASFGVAMYTARSGAGSRLFERADKALYAAKHGGRNRVEFSAAEGAWSA